MPRFTNEPSHFLVVVGGGESIVLCALISFLVTPPPGLPFLQLI